MPHGPSISEVKQIVELSVDDQQEKANAKLAEIVRPYEIEFHQATNEKVNDMRVENAQRSLQVRRGTAFFGGLAGLGGAIYTVIAMSQYGIQVNVPLNMAAFFLSSVIGSLAGWYAAR